MIPLGAKPGRRGAREMDQAKSQSISCRPAFQWPAEGNFLTTFLGETPVIVTRGHDGQIHAMLNRCAHRGNLVCLKRRGHADDLTCVYHAWRYDLKGDLKSVAFRRGVAGRGG